jgi:hypothetical protein
MYWIHAIQDGDKWRSLVKCNEHFDFHKLAGNFMIN